MKSRAKRMRHFTIPLDVVPGHLADQGGEGEGAREAEEGGPPPPGPLLVPVEGHGKSVREHDAFHELEHPYSPLSIPKAMMRRS